MTLGEQARVEGYAANLQWNGFTLRTSNGTSFQALVEDADSLDSAFLLGEDLREYVRINALRSDVPDISSQQIIFKDDGTQLKIVKRVDNPANPFIRFYATKKADVDT